MNEMTTKAGVGHNSGNVPGPETIKEILKEETAEIVKRADLLMVSKDRVPEKIETEEVSAKATEFVRQIAACHALAEQARKDAKQPYLDGGRAVDGFFKPVTDKLEAAKKDINKRIGAYLTAKEAAERAEREAREAAALEAEERARKEAEEAAAAAQTDEEKAAAIAKAREAEEAAAAARDVMEDSGAGPIVRGEYGGSSSLRKNWDFEIENINKIPLDHLRPYFTQDMIEKALRGFVKDGGRELRGVRIFETATAVTR